MDRRILWAVFTGLFVPYAGTMMWTGNVHGEELSCGYECQTSDQHLVLLDRGETVSSVPAEEYLPGVLALQVPDAYEMEALKAQAVIVRTYLYRQMEASGGGQSIAESALNLDCASADALKQKWGNGAFEENYRKLEEAVRQTKGLVMTFNGALIDPLFCRTSAGSTREGDEMHPYLKPADCPEDKKAPDFMQFFVFSKEAAAEALSSIPGENGETRNLRPEAFPDGVQIISRDDAGYVTQIQVDGVLFTGEEVRAALHLPSSCFFLEPSGENIRVITKGTGHGYGLSQTQAQKQAMEGWSAEEILGYFYKNIELVSE